MQNHFAYAYYTKSFVKQSKFCNKTKKIRRRKIKDEGITIFDDHNMVSFISRDHLYYI